MRNVYTQIKNWNLITKVFGDEFDKYQFHDGSLKRFDYNENTLTLVINACIGKTYDVTLKLSKLIDIYLSTEIGNDWIFELDIDKDERYKFLFDFWLDSVTLHVRCIEIEVVSVIEAEYFGRGALFLPQYNPNKEQYSLYIKNWSLITEAFDNDSNKYIFHDGTLKRLDYNENTLSIIINTNFGDDYDITLKMTELIDIKLDTEIGNDYIYDIDISKDKLYKFMFNICLNGVTLEVSCLNIEVVSVVEADYFQRGAIMLDKYDPKKGIDNTPMLVRY